MSEAEAPAPTPSPVPGALPGILSRAARRPYALLALVCLALWLPGILSLPVLDRDESRFAQSSRQMLESGNLVDIRFGSVPRYKKPVGIYWLQAAAAAATTPLDPADDHIWSYRLPSLLGGGAAVWLTFWCAGLFGAEVGLAAALLLGFSLLLTAEATIATTDAVLLACTLLMQGVLLRLYRAGSHGAPPPGVWLVLAGWAGFALAILVKGPVAPGVGIATIAALLAWDRLEEGHFNGRWLRATRPWLGAALTLAIVAPWLIAIERQSHGAFFQQSLGGDFAAKIAGGQESHGAPPGYYLVTAALAFWPAILFVLPGIGLALTRRREPAVRFLLAWAGSWWLVCEAVPTKLPHYVLPAYPALAILAAIWLLSGAPVATGWRRWLGWAAAAQFAIGLAAMATAPIMLPRLYGGSGSTEPWWLVAVAVTGGLAGLAALILMLRRRRGPALALSLLAFAVLAPVLTAGVGPRLNRLWVSERLATLVSAHTRPGDPPPALAGYEEPSLVFALGADVILTDGRGAAQAGADDGGLALVEDGERPAFLARLAEREADAQALGDLAGFNYSRGRRVHVTLYRVAKVTRGGAPPDAQPHTLPGR